MYYLRKHYGSLVLFVIALIPVVLWVNFVSIESLTSSWSTFISSLGKAAAFSGIALYSVMPVLSMRNKTLDVLFGGLDKLYVLHTKAGKVAFFLILAHPILLGLGRFIDGRSFSTIWNWTSAVVLVGILAFIVLSVVTFFSIYSHIKHQQWIWIHRVFGVLIPVFYIHAYIAQSQFVKNTVLFFYLSTLGILGFSAFLYRSVFARYFIKKHKYQVLEVNNITKDVAEIVLKPIDTPIVYEAGQFAFLSFESDKVDSEAHPYSFSNANNGPYVRFTIKSLGDDTKAVQKISDGTIAYVEGPFGSFSYKKLKNKKQVWIAGGIGITPFLSMARSFSGKKKYDIHFFYGTETTDEAVFLSEFKDVTMHKAHNFKTTVVSRDKDGFINAELLRKHLGDLKKYDFMICGPPGMMSSIKNQLKDSEVPDRQIHIEAFSI
jgi:predicted ferric reductase